MKVEHVRDYVVERLPYALNPRSIAVVGASRYTTKVGYKVIEGLKNWGYQGKIYPVNPRTSMMHGMKAYPRVCDIPDEVDLVFIAVPAHIVKSVLEDCVKKEAKIVVIATSAFKEIGRGELQNELTQYCRDHKLPLIGPNLVGMGSPYLNFNCGFIPYLPKKGPVAMISQSGANLLAALGTSQKDHFGMSFFVGLGNKADVDFCEFIAYAVIYALTALVRAHGLASCQEVIEARVREEEERLRVWQLREKQEKWTWAPFLMKERPNKELERKRNRQAAREG